MPDNRFFVSAIVPVYNGSLFLAEAIESILAQHYRAMEIIIVDDGSTDDTAAVANHFGREVRYIYQRQKGPAAARNHGARKARGDVIGFLDADDLWTKDKLNVQLARLQEDPKVDVVVGCTQRVREVKIVNGQLQFQPIPPLWVAFLLGSALFRRTVFETTGLFDETQSYGEDVDWFLRARELGVPIANLRHVAHLYRIHESNMTHDTSTGNRYFLQALKKSLDRRKQENGEVYELGLPSDLGKFQGNWRDLPAR